MSDHLIVFRIESLADSFFRQVLALAVFSINLIILGLFNMSRITMLGLLYNPN